MKINSDTETGTPNLKRNWDTLWDSETGTPKLGHQT